MGAHSSPIQRIGLIGGGQLGLMLAEAASRLDMEIHILDPDEAPPAVRGAVRHVRGALDDAEAIRELARGVDIISYEIESGDPGTLRRIGKPVEPSPATMEIIQDKLVQRRHLAGGSVPMPRFAALTNSPAKEMAEELRQFGFPLVHKVRRGGYDGRGVAVISNSGPDSAPLPSTDTRPAASAPADGLHLSHSPDAPSSAASAPTHSDGSHLPHSPIPWNDASYIEEAVTIDRELAVIVARSTTGEIAVYDPVEMHFDPALNLVDAVVYPAGITSEQATRARKIAQSAVATLPGAGVFAVELFLDVTGRILVNEIAPRPHNSGHLTIEAAETSQYEQHLRAITGLPLGDVAFHTPAVMRNLLGSSVAGPAKYYGLEKALKIPGVHLHLYGKRESRPGRKMGHITATGSDAWGRAEQGWRAITINGA